MATLPPLGGCDHSFPHFSLLPWSVGPECRQGGPETSPSASWKQRRSAKHTYLAPPRPRFRLDVTFNQGNAFGLVSTFGLAIALDPYLDLLLQPLPLLLLPFALQLALAFAFAATFALPCNWHLPLAFPSDWPLPLPCNWP